jgi:hypothetical protein
MKKERQREKEGKSKIYFIFCTGIDKLLLLLTHSSLCYLFPLSPSLSLYISISPPPSLPLSLSLPPSLTHLTASTPFLPPSPPHFLPYLSRHSSLLPPFPLSPFTQHTRQTWLGSRNAAGYCKDGLNYG